MENKFILIVIGIVGAIAALLLFVLLPISFADLQYYQYGFLRRKSTGSVDLGKVYGPGGRHLVGPDYEFKTFPAAMQNMEIQRAAVFTSDRLEVHVSVSLQYFLRKDQLPLLHKAYDIYYENVLEKNALDALKRASTEFSTREFIRDRNRVETKLFKEVRERLGGNCCEKDCSTKGNCVTGCRPYTSCLENQKGFFTEVRFFQLKEVAITNDVQSRFLQALILQEETEKEKFLQEAQLVQKRTDAQVNEKSNMASEISQNATAMSNLLQSKAQAESTATVEKARSQGLKDLYTRLGITDVDQKSSFDYLRTIKDMEHVHLTVDFEQMIYGRL